MKKKVLALGLIGILALTACEESPPKKVEESPVQDLPLEEAKEPVEEEAKEEGAKEEDIIDANKKYLAENSRIMEELNAPFGRIAELFANPTYSETWKRDLSLQIVSIQMLAEEGLALEEPQGDLKEVDKIWKEALGYYLKAMEVLPQAVDKQDMDLLDEFTAYIERGTDLIEETTDKLIAISQGEDLPEEPREADVNILLGNEQYLEDSMRIASDLREPFLRISELFSNPSLTDDWKIDLSIQIVTIQMLAEEGLALEEPQGDLKEVDKIWKKGLGYYLKSMEIMPQAVDSLDSDLLNRSSEYMELGTEYIEEATEMLAELIP